jgi:hypothetical protein
MMGLTAIFLAQAALTDARIVLMTKDLAFRLTLPAGYTMPPVDSAANGDARNWKITAPDGSTIQVDVEARSGKAGDIEVLIDARLTRDRTEVAGAKVAAEGTRRNLFGETAYVFRRTADQVPDRIYAVFSAKRTVTTIWSDRPVATRAADETDDGFWRVALSYGFITDRVKISTKKDGQG